jgi:hypothetical protein
MASVTPASGALSGPREPAPPRPTHRGLAVGLRVAQYGSRCERLLDGALRAERLGFHTLWVNDHLQSAGRVPPGRAAIADEPRRQVANRLSAHAEPAWVGSRSSTSCPGWAPPRWTASASARRPASVKSLPQGLTP